VFPKPVHKQRKGDHQNPWRLYRVFGLTLASDFHFASGLMPAEGAPNVTFTCVQSAPVPADWGRVGPSYVSPYRTEAGESVASLYRAKEFDVLRFARVADYYLWPHSIVCHLLNPAYGYLVEIRLLGPVLSFWLERRGVCALHASSVVVGGYTAAFLSGNSGGKTALAAALLRAGGLLLTDDILMVECRRGAIVGRPGYPQMRMWPDEARHFLGRSRNLERVHPHYSKRRIPIGADGLGSFCPVARKLDGIYVLERRAAVESGREIRIAPVRPQAAVMELLRHSFSPGLVEAAGLQPRRLSFLARMVRDVPVRKVVFPSGFQRLPRVCEAVSKDLHELR